jgi:hypothetical protein
MTQKDYISQILEPIAKPWVESKQRFILEEDGDSGHAPGKSNIVRTWKQLKVLSTTLIAIDRLISHLLKTVGNLQNNTSSSSSIGIRMIQNSWH